MSEEIGNENCEKAWPHASVSDGESAQLLVDDLANPGQVRREREIERYWQEILLDNEEFGRELLLQWALARGVTGVILGEAFERWSDLVFTGRTDLDDPVVGMDVCCKCGCVLDDEWTRGNDATDWLCSDCEPSVEDGEVSESGDGFFESEESASGAEQEASWYQQCQDWTLSAPTVNQCRR